MEYSTDNVEHWEKEVGTHSIHFLSHWTNEELRLYVLKNVDEVQNMANVFVKLHSTELSQKKMKKSPSFEQLQVDRNEKDIRRMQLVALQTWIDEKGSINEPLMEALLKEVSLAVTICNLSEPLPFPDVEEGPSFTEEDVLKWKLEKKNVEVERPKDDRLLQPNGQTVTVDISHILRCFSKNSQTRSPKKVRTDNHYLGTTKLKPTTELSTVLSTEWPHCAELKYHGIRYNHHFSFSFSILISSNTKDFYC